jgi:hypothetical protein
MATEPKRVRENEMERARVRKHKDNITIPFLPHRQVLSVMRQAGLLACRSKRKITLPKSKIAKSKMPSVAL